MDKTSTFTSEEIHESVEEVKRKRPDYASMLDLYEKIFIAQENSKKNIRLKDLTIPDDVLSQKIKEKFPLITISQFIIDNESSKELFNTICTILSESDSGLTDPIKKISDSINEEKFNHDELFAAILQDNEFLFHQIEETFSLDKKLLCYISFNSIKPSLALTSEKLSEKLDKNAQWEKGYCPVCGSTPEISLFEENGKRFLICGFCNHKWLSKRIYCPFCENTDHDSLHYYNMEDEEEYRVDVCDKCKKYIKTIDTKKTSRIIYPQLEYISTPHIDIRIEEMGFKKGNITD
jgi:FdhE protein